MSKRKSFINTAVDNTLSFDGYYMQLINIALSTMRWDNLPSKINMRSMELSLNDSGMLAFFVDDVVGYMCLPCTPLSGFNPYGVPTDVRAFSYYNSYTKRLKQGEFVLIYNNMTRTSTLPTLYQYANRLWDFDQTISINIAAQKTPYLLIADAKTKLSVLNAFKQIVGNEPAIATTDTFSIDSIKSFTTGAPLVADKLYQLKTSIWCEALNYLGVATVNTQKKERLISDEVNRGIGGSLAQRVSRLAPRKEAAIEINRLFGLNVSVTFNDYAEDGNEQLYNPT